MTVSARERDREGAGGSRPRFAVVAAIALLGVAGAAGGVALRLSSDHGGTEPGLQIALLDWIVLSYIFSGLVAWWRRPDNRLGPLMIAGGFLTMLTSLSSANSDLPFTVGQALDLVPFAVFLHVFLAFPSGHLRGRAERLVVAVAYVTAVGLQLLELMLGGFDPGNVLAVSSHPDLAATLFDVQLTILAAMALAGLALLARRRRADGRQLRRSASALVSTFSLALVLTAVLLL